jgi:hypothetical protein
VLGLDAEMATGFFEGDLKGPAQEKELDHTLRGHRRLGAEEGLRGEFAGGIDEQHPTDGQRGQSGRVPEADPAEHAQGLGALIPADGEVLALAQRLRNARW